jgi:hypothetical protein
LNEDERARKAQRRKMVHFVPRGTLRSYERIVPRRTSLPSWHRR